MPQSFLRTVYKFRYSTEGKHGKSRVKTKENRTPTILQGKLSEYYNFGYLIEVTQVSLGWKFVSFDLS